LGKNEQLELFYKTYDPEKMKALSFKESKLMPVHRWYPYVEGFSASWLQEQLQPLRKSSVIYDPFGGSGTTPFEASRLGIKSYYSEINPFMRFVTDTKINAARQAALLVDDSADYLFQYLGYINSEDFKNGAQQLNLEQYYSAFPNREFFEEEHIRDLLHAKEAIKNFTFPAYISSLILLSIASIAVECSNMTRRADLRKRRPNEYKNRVVNVRKSLTEKIYDIIFDLRHVSPEMAETYLLSNDAKEVVPQFAESFDFAITSPPYINGTNYIRNTKIEIWLTGFIESEKELKNIREKTVCGGITDATKTRIEKLIKFPFVEEVATQLDEVAYDKRIPLMVRSYFSDMYKVLENVFKYLKNDARFVLDIGDSKFSDVHVPADSLLMTIGEQIGFQVERVEHLARRYSRDKTELTQVAITFRK